MPARSGCSARQNIEDMVTARYAGRFGNNLFQTATTIAHALDNNTDYKFRKSFITDYFNLPQLNGQVPTIIYNEPEFYYNPLPYFDNMELRGWFQSEKYFYEYREVLLNIFNPALKIDYNTVSVHVRRGDYLTKPDKHPPVTLEYLVEAMSMFPNFVFKIFSDDIGWCRQNIKGEFYGESIIDDFKEALKCEHHIISNSSLSWWWAWLCRNPDKQVIAPKKWFGENLPNDTKDLIPEGWQRL